MNGTHRFFARATLIGGFVTACTAAGQPHAGDEGNAPPAQPSASEAGAGGDQTAAAGAAAEAGTSGNSGKQGVGAHPHGGSGSGGAAGADLGGADDPGVHATGVPGDGALPGAAGAGDDAGASSGGASAASECDIDGGCAAVCHGQSARCAVAHAGYSCELAQFENTATTVACGETATIGTADCGGCGTVAVEVYFDGSRCWEGMPDCALSGFTGTFFVPHSPE
ncbi:MAG: hypothetical protein ABJB12_16420 [Pseudomonadota bacterium]